MRWFPVTCVLCSIAIAAIVVACSSSSQGGGVVSCDVDQAGLHYCEEFSGAASSNTGCPKTAGVTPGTGCSRAGVVGTCTQGPYEIFVYVGATASEIASVCPADGGTVSGEDGGAGGGPDGSSATGSATNQCSMTVSGTSATGSAVSYTVDAGPLTPSGGGGASVDWTQGHPAGVSCLVTANGADPDGGGGVLSQTEWVVELDDAPIAPITITDTNLDKYVSFHASAGSGPATTGGSFHWSCAGATLADGGVEILGTWTFAITSSEPSTAFDNNYAIHGTGHAVCPSITGNGSTATIDVTF